VSGALVLSATNAAFTATTTNPGNTLAAGTVALSDDDAGNALFNLSNLKPGDTTTQCITVSYTGSLGAQLRMYAATTGTGLGADLNLKLTRGTFATPPGGGDCTGFSADSTDYIARGAGVIYDAALSSFASTWAAGTVDPSASTFPTAEVWTANEAHAYQLTLTLPSGTANSEQGKTASTTFTWETRDASDAASGGVGSYYANAVLADNPASFWRLNETSGTTASDLGSGAHNGTFQNGVALNRPGPLRDAASSAQFDGSDDEVSVGNVYNYNGTAAFSVEFWVKRTNPIPSWDRIVDKGTLSPARNGWDVMLDPGPPGGYVVLERWNNNSWSGVGTSTPIPLGVWTHVVVTYDGSDACIYVNGAQDVCGSGGAIPSTTQGLALGSIDGGGGPLTGGLADVAIYSSALSPTQVAAHYNARN
jgi:hypothetical protein